MLAQVQPDMQRLKQFCKKWKIAELALFGSALRNDFRVDSDVDLLVTFMADSPFTILWDHSDMEDELEKIFGRKVDLASRRGIERSENYIRRSEIINSAKVIYAVE